MGGVGVNEYLLKCKTLGGIHMQSTAAMQRCVYTAHARTSASLPRSTPSPVSRLFTPVAPVASNIRPTSCPSRSFCVSLVRESG